VYEKNAFVPCAKIINGENYSIVSDYIGRPVQAYNEDGQIVWSTDYDIYGNLKNLKGNKYFIPFRQLGQYEDRETDGLYYNRFRYYDTNSGLFISLDPIGLAGNNATLYANVNDSNTEADVFGLHIADAIYTNSSGITGQVGSFGSQKGGLHSEPQILNQMGGQKGGHLEITSMGPKGDGTTSFFRGKGGKPFPAGPLPPCGPRSNNCDSVLFSHAKSNNMTISYKWTDLKGNTNVRTYHPDGKVTENGIDISAKYYK